MAYFADYKGLDFDDVLLEPQASDLLSRSEVSTGVLVGKLSLRIPIISANMDSVTGLEMCKAMAEVGGFGIRHRYSSHEDIKKDMVALLNNSTEPVPSIGVNGPELDFAKDLFHLGVRSVCVDVAHGDSSLAADMVYACRNMGFDTVIAGNVATSAGALRLYNAGANVVKVGIGPGSVCTTRLVTGHGVPQMTAIMNVAKAANMKFSVIADGGMKTPGDVVKALAAGADAVMLGSMLSGTSETPGEETVDGLKLYRGMASAEAQLEFRGKVGNGTAEGEVAYIVSKGPVANVIAEIMGGIRSGCSYSGAHDLHQLRKNAIFVEVNRVKQ